MKKGKIAACVIMCILIFGFFYRYQMLKQEYPTPEVKSYGIGDTLKQGNFSITFQKEELIDGNQLEKLAPGTVVAAHADGTPYQGDELRVAMLHVRIEKTKECEDTFDFTPITAESGAWGNGLNPEIFMQLNKGISITRAKIDYHTPLDVVLPFSMIDTMFRDSDWKKIDSRRFSVVFTIYPVKNIMFVNGENARSL